MQGAEFLDILKQQLSATSDADLARKLGFTSSHIANTRTQKNVGARRVESFISKLTNHRVGLLLKEAVHPIVEYFPLDYAVSRSEKKWEIINKSEHPELYKELNSQIGLYSFYNSEREIVYVGKTEKQTLWREMNIRLNSSMPHYMVMGVQHARGKWKPNADGKVRQIRRVNQRLYDTCHFFSAYRVGGDLVSALESLLIRFVANDIINVRMETGKTKKSLGEWED